MASKEDAIVHVHEGDEDHPSQQLSLENIPETLEQDKSTRKSTSETGPLTKQDYRIIHALGHTSSRSSDLSGMLVHRSNSNMDNFMAAQFGGDIGGLKEKAAATEKRLDELLNELHFTKEQLRQATEQNTALKEDNSRLRLQCETLETQCKELKSELEKTRQELHETKTNLEETKTNLEETKTNLEETKTNLEETKANLKETNTKLEETNTTLHRLSAIVKKAEAKSNVKDATLLRGQVVYSLISKVRAYFGNEDATLLSDVKESKNWSVFLQRAELDEADANMIDESFSKIKNQRGDIGHPICIHVGDFCNGGDCEESEAVQDFVFKHLTNMRKAEKRTFAKCVRACDALSELTGTTFLES